MDDALKVESRLEGDVGIITADGEVDMSTMRLLREAVREEVGAGACHLILDMRGVDYMDSSGMSIIMTAKKLTAEHNGKVYLITQTGSVARALELVRVYHLVELADTPEEALKALAGG